MPGPNQSPPRPDAPWLERLPIADRRLRRLASYWDRLRGQRPMPRFDELEPWEFPDLLPMMWAWRVDRAQRLMFLRLVGEEVQRVLGKWPRGAELAEAVPEDAQNLVRRRYERVAYGPAILYVRGWALLGGAVRVPAERLVLPLGSGSAADDLLGISHYDLSPHRQGLEDTYLDEESADLFLPLSEIS